MGSKEKTYIIAADYYGDIPSNGQLLFWLPINRGTLFLSDEEIRYKKYSRNENTIEVSFQNIIKTRLFSLEPKHNLWNKKAFGSPYYLLFWIAFWNRYLINITYLDNQGHPRELFFKLRTEANTYKTFSIIKEKIKRTLKVKDKM